jgi:hypothetical protein
MKSFTEQRMLLKSIDLMLVRDKIMVLNNHRRHVGIKKSLKFVAGRSLPNIQRKESHRLN